MQPWQDFIKEVLIPEDVLQKRLVELGSEISRDYAGEQILVVCILRGGVMFMADLVKHISVPLATEFMAVTSYGTGARKSSGEVRITLDLNSTIAGKHVLIVEDIIDSGHTLASVIELLQTRNPKDIYVCTLLDKFERREVDVPVRYTGFRIDNHFVFGYGLDMDEYYRNLPFIGTVDLEKYDPSL
jgi:hypoxanthine phosphoribosyltransferase